MSRQKAIEVYEFLSSLEPSVAPDERWISRFVRASTTDSERREMILIYRLLNHLSPDQDWTRAIGT